MSRRRKQLPDAPGEATIESLSHEGRGIAHIDGKIIFIDGALPGETVRFNYTGQRSRFAEGAAFEVTNSSPDRVDPGCSYFAICGGCSLQHMSPQAQIAHKEQVLFEQLRHIGGVEPADRLPPLTGEVWGYRHKARLGVKYVQKKGKVLVGFREKNKPYIADIDSCEVLHPVIGKKLIALKELVNSLQIRSEIPQMEVAIGDDNAMIVVRHMVDLPPGDRALLQQFEAEHGIGFLLQGNHAETVLPLAENGADRLMYKLDDYGVQMEFTPLDFTQINFRINRDMIRQVIELMRPEKTDHLLDLFCGLGNFTLPLARHAAFVTGVEGATRLVEKARLNAVKNAIDNVEFQKADLYLPAIQGEFLRGRFDKVLMDPPRSGAQEVIEQMKFSQVHRLVYVSCNPATLARDAGLLVKLHGFNLVSAGVMDMFPHTTHVESLAVFEKN